MTMGAHWKFSQPGLMARQHLRVYWDCLHTNGTLPWPTETGSLGSRDVDGRNPSIIAIANSTTPCQAETGPVLKVRDFWEVDPAGGWPGPGSRGMHRPELQLETRAQVKNQLRLECKQTGVGTPNRQRSSVLQKSAQLALRNGHQVEAEGLLGTRSFTTAHLKFTSDRTSTGTPIPDNTWKL